MTPPHERKKKLAIAVNTIAPYRMPIYTALAEQFDTIVMHGGREANRNWELKSTSNLGIKRVFTMQLPIRRRTGVANVYSKTYLHFNFGLLWDLFRFRPEIIVSNELGLRTMMSILFAKVMRKPLWIWWGGTPHSERHIGWFKRTMRRFLARHIRRWISYGSTSTQYLESSLAVPRANILQIQNCVPHENFLLTPPDSPLWFREDPHPVLLAVGQLIARKGLDRLIESCARLAERGKVFTLALVGDGPDREALMQLAAKLKLPNLRFIASQPQSKLNEIYKSAQAFIFPTAEDVWGLVANEALWAGLPLLCSKYAGCAQEIVPKENVFDPLSPEDFDRALERAIDGHLSPPDLSCLLTWQQVSALIATSLDTGVPAR